MAFMEWSDDFELGVPQFDNHHKHLVSLLNSIYAGMGRSSGGDVVGNVLNDLIDYATYHFDAEEKWMAEKHFPGLAKHRIEHDQFRARMVEIHRDYTRGHKGLSLEILEFLKTWLATHIVGSDAEYGRFVLKAEKRR